MQKQEIEEEQNMEDGPLVTECNCYHMVGVIENEALKAHRDPDTIPWKQRWP